MSMPAQGGDATELTLDGTVIASASPTQRASALALASATPQFELWACVADGPSLCMLRNGEHAWLMYLREPGDSGFHSCGDADRVGDVCFRLDNGQLDSYPLAWCIDIGECLAALAFFHANAGARPAQVTWQEA